MVEFSATQDFLRTYVHSSVGALARLRQKRRYAVD